MVETEIKLAWADTADAARSFLEGNHYDCEQPRHLESDTLFDRLGPNDLGELQCERKALRLRRTRSGAIITYKGPPSEGPHKSREEIEFSTSSPDAAQLVLERLGYQPWFRYEKYRSIFRAENQPGIITLDETPMGIFLELEGPAEWIDSTARALGFGSSVYITASYAALYRAYREKYPQAPRDMVFVS